MNTTTHTLKEEVHAIIDDIDDVEVLKAVHTLVKPYSHEYELTNEQVAELDRRMEDYKNGIGKSYTLEEAKQYFKDLKK